MPFTKPSRLVIRSQREKSQILVPFAPAGSSYPVNFKFLNKYSPRAAVRKIGYSLHVEIELPIRFFFRAILNIVLGRSNLYRSTSACSDYISSLELAYLTNNSVFLFLNINIPVGTIVYSRPTSIFSGASREKIIPESKGEATQRTH